MRSGVSLLAFAVGVLCVFGGTARADDQPLPGTRLVIRDDSSINVHKVNLILKSPSLFSPQPSSSDDPTHVGATFEVVATSGEAATFRLPASGWSVDPRRGGLYRYSDPNPLAPVRLAVIRNGSLISVETNTAGITLDEQSQQSVGIILTSGSRRYCAIFGGAAVRRDQPGRFLARGAPAPAACPLCGNGIKEFGEQCDDGNTQPLDGCSAICQTEQSTTAVASTADSYAAAFDGDQAFQAVYGHAQSVGYSGTLQNVLQYSEGNAATAYSATLQSLGSNGSGVLVSRHDVSANVSSIFDQQISANAYRLTMPAGIFDITCQDANCSTFSAQVTTPQGTPPGPPNQMPAPSTEPVLDCEAYLQKLDQCYESKLESNSNCALCAVNLFFCPVNPAACVTGVVACLYCSAALDQCGPAINDRLCVGDHCVTGYCSGSFTGHAVCAINPMAPFPCNEPTGQPTFPTPHTCCDHTTGTCCNPLCGPYGPFSGSCNAQFASAPLECNCCGYTDCYTECGLVADHCGSGNWEENTCPNWPSDPPCGFGRWCISEQKYDSAQCAP